MCGIFGLATSEGTSYQNRRPKIFKEGMHFSMLRGEDAAGIAGIREVKNSDNQKVPQISVYKRAVHVVDFMNTKGFDRVLQRFSDFYYVLGHVRASTVGGAYDQNAHPFMYDDITLVHNGTVPKHKLNVKPDEDVDSAFIALSMAEFGEEATLANLEGAYSLVWHNAADDSLNFARNERKPMALAFVKGRNEMYYASEWRMLWCLLGRNDVEIEGNIQITKPHTHYKFHKEDLRKWVTKPYKAPSANPRSGVDWPDSRKPIVHPPVKSTATHTPANAALANNSTKNGQSSTSTPDTTSSVKSMFGERNENRKHKLTELVRNYGWEFGTQLVLRPAEFVPHTDGQGLGRIIFEHPSHEYAELLFVMYRVSYARWEHYDKLGKVAVALDNFLEQNDNTLRLIVRESPDLQKVLERQEEMFAKLEAHGFKEDPKSDGYNPAPRRTIPITDVSGVGLCSVTIDSRTGEVLDEPEEDPESNEPVFRGPFGSRITLSEFRELCRHGCGHCDGDLDVRDYAHISWHGSSIICEHCTNDPTAQAELANTKSQH